MKMLDEYAKDKSEEQILNIRMHQLALAKVIDLFIFFRSLYLHMEKDNLN